MSLFFLLFLSLQTKLFYLRSIHVDIVEQEGNKDMDALSAVMDKVKSHPEVVEKVKDEVMSLADALHLRRHGKACIVFWKIPIALVASVHPQADRETFASSLPWTGSKDKEPESEEKTEEGEAAQNVDEGASADKAEEPNVVEQAVEEIQAVVAAVQQQTAPTAETETPTETSVTAETSAEGDKPEETNREVEKDDPKKRLDFFGFFAMLFERFCSPANKKKD